MDLDARVGVSGGNISMFRQELNMHLDMVRAYLNACWFKISFSIYRIDGEAPKMKGAAKVSTT
jgi:hypothetical protein